MGASNIFKTFSKEKQRDDREAGECGEVVVNDALVDALAPSAVHFCASHIEINGRARRYCGIRQFAYHNKIGWLDDIKKLPQPSITIQVSPADKEEIISGINRTEALASLRRERARSASKAVLANAEADEAVSMMEMVADRDTAFLACSYTVCAEMDNDTDLRRKISGVKEICSPRGITIDDLPDGQESAFRACDPMADFSDPYLAPRFKAILEAGALAAMSPFDTAGLMDADGVELGVDAEGALVRVNMIKTTHERTTGHIALVGKSGKGKSYCLKSIACHEYAFGSRIIWLDWEQEAKTLCKNLHGQYLNCSSDGVTLSPLQYRTTNFNFLDDLDAVDADIPLSPLRSTVQFLGGFYQLAFGIGDDDLPYLYEGLEKAYAKRGVTYATAYSDIDSRNYPTMDEVADEFDNLAKECTIPSIQKIYLNLGAHTRTGGERGLYGDFWGGTTDIDLDSDFVVFDLSALTNVPESVRNAQMYSILSYVWGEVCKSRTTGTPLRLILDEAHMLLGSTVCTDGNRRISSVSTALLSQICRRARKYGAGVAIATQSLHEFDCAEDRASKDAQAIFSNMTYVFAFGMEEWRLAAELLQIPAEKAKNLPHYKKGRCIFKAGALDVLDLDVRKSEDLEVWFGSAGGK